MFRTIGIMKMHLLHNLGPQTARCVCVCMVQDVADHRRQLEALPDERECRQEEERLTGEMQGLEKTCQYQDIDMKATVEKLQKIDAEV